MGTWGPGIFDNNLAEDIREDFTDLIADGLSPDEATARLVAEYEPDAKSDPEDAVGFWTGLAATQWALGRPTETARRQAIDLIQRGADLTQWAEDCESPRLVKKRAAALNKLVKQLQGKPKKPKPVKKRDKADTVLREGQVILYRLPSGNCTIFRVVTDHRDRGGRMAFVQLCDWTGPEDQAPNDPVTLANLPGLRPTHLRDEPEANLDAYCTGFALHGTLNNPEPLDRFRVITTLQDVPNRGNLGTLIGTWDRLDAYLDEVYGLQ